MAKGLVYVIDDAHGEYATLKSYLASRGYELFTAVGARDVNVNYDIDLKNISDINELIKNYDMYILIGGYKMFYFVTNKKPPTKKTELAIDTSQLAELTKGFTKAGAVVIAPLATPAYLASQGLLSGLKATVYPVTELIKILKENNVIYYNEPIIRDKNIITIKDVKKITEKELAETLREGT